MDLSAAGLSPTESRVYTALLSKNEWKPSELAKSVGETRTNVYKILDKLVNIKLANRYDKDKKLHYSANNPTQLLALAAAQRKAQEKRELGLRNNIKDLSDKYYKSNERPGVQFFQGPDGIRQIYLQQVEEAKPIHFFKTWADIDFFGFSFMHGIRNMAPRAGIKRKAFTPDAPETPINNAESDKLVLLERVWYETKDYTAPVEWSIYGNKVSIISFGQEAMGMTIDSPQIAESLRQIFALLEEGLKRRPNYTDLPRRHEFTDVESFVQKYNNKLPRIKDN